VDELEQRCKPRPAVIDLHDDVAISVWVPCRGPVAVARKQRAGQPVFPYCSIRGSPKCGKALLSANHVMADIWLP